MVSSKLVEKLEYEVKYLLWKAKIHNLSANEIERRYHLIEQNYLSQSDNPEIDILKFKLAGWNDEIKRVSGLN